MSLRFAEDGPFAAAQQWGSKSGGKELFALTGIPAFRGRPEALFSVEEVTMAARRLARSSPPADHVIVKLDDPGWSGGLGNAVVDCAALFETAALTGAVEPAYRSEGTGAVDSTRWEDIAAEIPRSGAIVEEYFPGASGSPSGQGSIGQAGAVRVVGTHDQLLDQGFYRGCTYPAREEVREQIAEAVRLVGQALAARGVRGAFGVDFVAFEDGRLVAAEVNVRKVAPTHVMTYVESAVGERLGPSGQLLRSGRPISYVHRRLFHPDSLSQISISRAIAALKRSGLLWDATHGSGALLHILGALSAHGYLEITSIAGTAERARQLDADVQAALSEEARRRRPGRPV